MKQIKLSVERVKNFLIAHLKYQIKKGITRTDAPLYEERSKAIDGEGCG